MKKIILLISLAVGIYACQQDWTAESPLPADPGTESRETAEKVPLSFRISLPSEVLGNTTLEPMSRAGSEENLSKLDNAYKAVLIKYTDSKWIIDTVISGWIDTSLVTHYPWGSTSNELYVKKNTPLPTVQMALRPGLYKMGFFLNVLQMRWNEALKPGYVVSENPSITSQDNLPHAYLFGIQTSTDYQNLNYINMNREPFAGMATFEVGKNNDLHTPGSQPTIDIPMIRKVARMRFLLKTNPDFPNSKDGRAFSNTAYTIYATLKSDASHPFCDGANVLGGVYYAPTSTTTLRMMVSTSGKLSTSPENNASYYMMLPGGSTYLTPYVMIDETQTEGIPCNVKIEKITGQSGGWGYKMKDNTPDTPITIKPNSIHGIVIEVDFDTDPPEYLVAYAKLVPGEDPDLLFPPFYEWNN